MTAEIPGSSAWFLMREARGLLLRLAEVRPFSLTMPHVRASAPSLEAWYGIERHLHEQRERLEQRVTAYLRWLAGEGRACPPSEQQRRIAALRMRFNEMLTQVDIFADVVNQRSEQPTGLRLAGLDAVAADALSPFERFSTPPPLVTYLDRGHGAAIRRARTRLPGGARNPVAVVRVPRERMLSSGVGASLVHEVGHQGAALLGLVGSLRAVLRRRMEHAVRGRPAWALWERWVGEVVADYWALGTLGIAATTGMLGVLSLPRALVFRHGGDGPHPTPWIRVRLSCAMGDAFYPDPQWSRLFRLWEALHPIDRLTDGQRRPLVMLERTMPELVERIAEHRPRSLRGMSLGDLMPLAERQPNSLRAWWGAWKVDGRLMRRASPTLVLAVLGQARWDDAIGPARERMMLDRMLERWAYRRAMAHPTARVGRGPVGAGRASCVECGC